MSTSLQTRTRLDTARALTLPTRESTLRRDPAVTRFWEQNATLLAEAWAEWEAQESDLPVLDDTLIEPRLREAVDAAWASPDAEDAVRDLWKPVVPGVYQTPFFDPARLPDLRAYLDRAADAQIPTRPPYGIVLNRHGVMLDRRSSGYLAGPGFQAFYDQLIARYMRPISRLLFPEVTGYDTQSFGFSIRYQPGLDTSIRPHTDASATTLNLNLNLPGEAFAGSEVDFYTRHARQPVRFAFEPGVAALHRGSVAHAAQPITSGERSNLVLWLYGDRMAMPQAHERGPDVEIAAAERWAPVTAAPDRYAPF